MNEFAELSGLVENQHVDEMEFRDVAVLLVGHGTRQLAGQDDFRELYRNFANCLAPIVTEMAFLELAEPSISQAVEQIAVNKEIRCLLVVPTLLFTAGHALQDIPQAVEQALQSTEIRLIGQTPAIECSSEVLQLSAIRFRQTACPDAKCVKLFDVAVAKCDSNDDPQAVQHAKRLSDSPPPEFPCHGTHWILVGRGSSSLNAAAKMREFCRLRQQWTPVREATTAFIYGQSPSVLEAFQAAADSDAPLVVVQPHLLFQGLLLDELTEKVHEFAERNPHQRWLITQPLGADQKLAELLAQVARNSLLELRKDRLGK